MSSGAGGLTSRLVGGLSWTAASLVILALSGIAINLIIMGLRGAPDLGVFNQAFAIYIVSSQLAVLGVHNSVMRHAAYYSGSPVERRQMLGDAVVLCVITGLVSAGLLHSIAPLIGTETTVNAIRYAALGLALFPLSKALLALLNGLQLMKSYALLQSLRYITLTSWVAGAALWADRIEVAVLGFLVAELVTTICALAYLHITGHLTGIRCGGGWLLRHLSFGSRSLLSNTFVELNSRVDVLLIGHFLGDRQAGVYSFAAVLIDGLYQVWHVVRVNFNPVLVNALRDGDQEACATLLRKSRPYLYGLGALLAAGILLAYWVAITWFLPGRGLEQGMIPLVILLCGIGLVSAFIPFDHLPLAGGYPMLQTLQQFIVVLANFCLCLVLIPMFGINGAAVATASSYIGGVMVLVLMVRRLYSWNLISNTFKA